MKTVDYVDKGVRDGSTRDLTTILIIFGISSFLFGMILGYSKALNFIKNRILQSFKEEIKISTKAKTAITGKLHFITDGLKLKSIFLDDNSFEVESEMAYGVIENQIASKRDEYMLMMGEDILKKVEQKPENNS
jgi:hypothetical protein